MHTKKTLPRSRCRAGRLARGELPERRRAARTSARRDGAGVDRATSRFRRPMALQLVVAPDGNEVRYRVREQLVGLDLPNDAVGATSDVTGGIAFDAAGKLVPASSKFVVNVGTLKSDKDRRDGYVRGRILETTQYPDRRARADGDHGSHAAAADVRQRDVSGGRQPHRSRRHEADDLEGQREVRRRARQRHRGDDVHVRGLRPDAAARARRAERRGQHQARVHVLARAEAVRPCAYRELELAERRYFIAERAVNAYAPLVAPPRSCSPRCDTSRRPAASTMPRVAPPPELSSSREEDAGRLEQPEVRVELGAHHVDLNRRRRSQA